MESWRKGREGVFSPNEKPKAKNADPDHERAKAMRHLQPDLAGGHVGEGDAIALCIDPCDRDGIGSGNELAVGEGEIRDRKIAMLMAHGGAKSELRINDHAR